MYGTPLNVNEAGVWYAACVKSIIVLVLRGHSKLRKMQWENFQPIFVFKCDGSVDKIGFFQQDGATAYTSTNLMAALTYDGPNY